MEPLLIGIQLDDARRDHDGARTGVEERTESIRERANEFQQEQADIDDRLRMVTESDTSEDAVQRFEASMQELQKLEVATGYVELLREVDTLRKDCTVQLGKSDKGALAPYRRLQHLVASLQPLQEAAEGAAPHLLDHIRQEVHSLRQTIHKSFSDDLEKTLKKMNWPKPTKTVPMALQHEWSTNVGRLLSLQHQELEDRESLSTSPSHEEPPALLPLEVLVQPLEQRFGYHFSGNRPTNRLDKPEYFLSHITELISTYSDFVQNALQPVLLEHFRGSDLAFIPAYIDAVSSFITALLPMLKRKLLSFASQVSDQPRLLSHLVHEVMAFDTTLQEAYAYAPTSPAVLWRGLAYYLLDTCGYFEQWLQVERDFALARYQSIVDSPESSEIDYDSFGADVTKPMKSAIRLNDLLDTITDRYRSLSSFSQKIRFLIDIQISIFDLFNQRLRNSLDAYIAASHTITRAVPGVPRENLDEIQGIKGLKGLCRVFGSAEYLERAMRDWSDDVFFLELYDELQSRSQQRTTSAKLGDLQAIQQKTSLNLHSSDEETSGALFDETAGLYHRLRVRSETLLVEAISTAVREALRPYANINTWASLSVPSNNNALTTAPSPDLDTLFRLLSEYLPFLRRTLSTLALRRLVRQTCQTIQAYFWDHILLRHTFSTAGAGQLSRDLHAICESIDHHVAGGAKGASLAKLAMRKVLEGATLLSLPVQGESARLPALDSDEQQQKKGEDSAWDDDDDPQTSSASPTIPKDGKSLGLFEADRAIFQDNDSARSVLEEFGWEVLSVAEAREVLRRRVEVRG